MAVSYTKDQEELLRKMRGDSAFPDAYNPPSILGTTPLVKPQPTGNPLFQGLPPTNAAAALADPYRAVTNPPRVIGPQPPAPSAPTYTASDTPPEYYGFNPAAGFGNIARTIGSGLSMFGVNTTPPEYRNATAPQAAPSNTPATAPGFMDSVRQAVGAIDRLIPSATPAASTPAATTPQAPRQRLPDAAGNYNFDVTTTGNGVSFANDISSGSITGLNQEQINRVAEGLRTGNRNRGVVPSSFFTGGSAGGSQIPGFDDDTVARLTRAANERVDIGNMRPADAATALSERNYARQQLQQLRGAMAGGANAQAQANAEVQKAIAVEQVRRASPDWKTSDIEVVDPKSPTGVRKTQVLSAPDGRTYQVPDAQDIATLAAAPNDQERVRLLRLAGVPDEHIPMYLARFH
jgi:hypothetical protein